MGEGAVSFAYSHPMSSWVASILTCFAGTFLSNFLLGNSLLSPLTDLEQIAILSVIWYLVFFCPLDLFTKVFMLKPLWIALLVVKEAHRARNILKGVEMSSTLHHDAWLVMIAIIRKGKSYKTLVLHQDNNFCLISLSILITCLVGAGSRLLRPVVLFAQGKVDAINEALYPSFVTKLSIVGSVLFIVVQKRMVAFTSAEVLLGITCVGAFLQVLMDLSNTSDPFTYLEKAVAAVLFREPAEKADTSDAKKKKE
ncbi:Trimeric intracellular cation channel type A [Stylophora pistillata]|uniref:Trimeric intracellular cation channel type A n=1 Tax=Stylophora pistillata TaxID=50429 RepID=A0A2B4SUN7_STYPI|nr:Trimeric intracellular cation channel type A [Stylophora pistillata]